jgi:hypothetical protein
MPAGGAMATSTVPFYDDPNSTYSAYASPTAAKAALSAAGYGRSLRGEASYEDTSEEGEENEENEEEDDGLDAQLGGEPVSPRRAPPSDARPPLLRGAAPPSGGKPRAKAPDYAQARAHAPPSPRAFSCAPRAALPPRAAAPQHTQRFPH